MHDPPHPGEVLRELCLEPLGVTVTDAANEIDVAGAVRVRDPHAAAADRVAEVPGVKMAFVANRRWERATENSLVGVLVQLFTDR